MQNLQAPLQTSRVVNGLGSDNPSVSVSSGIGLGPSESSGAQHVFRIVSLNLIPLSPHHVNEFSFSNLLIAYRTRHPSLRMWQYGQGRHPKILPDQSNQAQNKVSGEVRIQWNSAIASLITFF